MVSSSFLTCVSDEVVDVNDELLNEDDDEEDAIDDDDDMNTPHLVMCQFDKVNDSRFSLLHILTMMDLKLILQLWAECCRSSVARTSGSANSMRA